jgi:hypothetical protein
MTAPIWLLNPRRKAKRRGAPRKRRFSKKQLAAQRKFAAMARARAKAARPKRRAHTKGGSMARRRRRAAARRRSPARHRRRAVTRYSAAPKRRYRSNPRRRHRTRIRHYRRNPGMGGGIVRQTGDLFLGAGVALVGAAAGRTISNVIPFGQGDPIMGFVKGVAVAIGIRVLGPKVGLKPEWAKLAAIGAMMGPTKDLIVSFVPQAGSFLGAGPMLLPRFPRAPAGLHAYSGAVEVGESDGQLGTYAAESYPS